MWELAGILLVLFVSLTVFLWLGTFLFQGYIYLEPVSQLFWKAPAAALLLVFGYGIWCFSIALTSDASPQNIPIDSLFRFSPRIDMLPRPAKKIWAIKIDRRKSAEQNKDGIVVPYVCQRDGQTQFHYEDTTLKKRPWDREDVIAIEIETKDGQKLRFNKVDTAEKVDIRTFRSDDGWIIRETADGPTGNPERFNFGRLVLNLMFNFGHLFVWFLALWIVLRYQWAHALGLAVVLWAIVTLTVLPTILSYSGHVAEGRVAGGSGR